MKTKKDIESIAAWKNNHEHKLAQELGKNKWYKKYEVHISIVE